MRPVTRLLPVLFTALALVACNSDDDDDTSTTPPPTSPAPPTTPPPPPAPVRGQLLETPPAKLATYAPADLLAKLGGNDLGKLLVNILLAPKCSVDVHQLKYETVGAAANEMTSASGALMVPNGSDPACQGPRPIVMYAHGTTPLKTYNIANLEDNSNGEGMLIAAVFASQGYIVIAPNYAGYDTSTLAYHPYLNADQQSKDMIDALAAARSALPLATQPTITDGGKLYLTGYSQGGYVAMATHKAMQAAGTVVTASAPMSGPYALSAFGDAIFQGQVSGSAPLNVALLVSSYQHAYGNLYTATTDIFEAPYATGIDTLLPSATNPGDLYAQGKLPKDFIFNSTPPDPSFAAITPATQPAELASVFAKGFGTPNLVTNAYRLAYLQDSQAQPDGGFPTLTNNQPPAAPANTFRQALKTNDLRNWSPTAPVLLCGGNQDPTVFFTNTTLIQSYWTGVAPTASVTVLDVDSPATSGDPYETEKDNFTAAKNAVKLVSGDDGVFENYHAGLVPPFCLRAVKNFFDTH